MATAGALRPLLAGLAGGAGGVLISQLLSRKEEAPVPDVTFEELPRNLLATDRAGEILKFGAPKEGVSGPLIYKNHVLAYDSARRVPKWVAEHLSRDVAAREQVELSVKIRCSDLILQVANRKGVNFGPDPTVPKEFSSENRYWKRGQDFGKVCCSGIIGEVVGLEGTWHQRGTTNIARTA